MLDPNAEQALLDIVSNGLESEIRKAHKKLIAWINAGVPPRDAVQTVMTEFQGPYADTLARGFTAILGRAIGSVSVLAMKVGDVALSARLYDEAAQVSQIVQGVVSRHAAGWMDARRLTLQIFEGYGFRETEPLRLDPRNGALPKYLRSELLTDPGVLGDLERHFARLQAEALKTPALKAAYLQALEEMEGGNGGLLLEKKLRVAFQERMRYFANRIAQTELHRAYAERQAVEILADDQVEYVQWRLSGSHPRLDICDYFAKVDAYGLGPGVYPKGQAPIAPAHPYCRCVLSPRLDIPLGTKVRKRSGADREFLSKFSETSGGRIMGSAAKRARVLNGESAWGVWNEKSPPLYQVKRAVDVRDLYGENPLFSKTDPGAAILYGKPSPLDQIVPAVLAKLVEKAPPPPPPTRPWDPETPAGKWHDAGFQNAPGYVLRAIEKTDVPLVSQTPRTGAYCMRRVKIEMGSGAYDNLRDSSTWRHEYGHWVDGHGEQIFGTTVGPGGRYYVSSGFKFRAALKDDAMDIAKASGYGRVSASTDRIRADLKASYTKAVDEILNLEGDAARRAFVAKRFEKLGFDFDEIEREFKAHTVFAEKFEGVGLWARYNRIAVALEKRDANGLVDYLMGSNSGSWYLADGHRPEMGAEHTQAGYKGITGHLSDLFGAATKNKVADHHIGHWGHSRTYYKREGAAETEVFANLFSLHGAGGGVWPRIAELMMPRTNNVFMGLLNGL